MMLSSCVYTIIRLIDGPVPSLDHCAIIILGDPYYRVILSKANPSNIAETTQQILVGNKKSVITLITI